MNHISDKIYELLNCDEKIDGYANLNETDKESDIVGFIKKNPNPKDIDLHTWVQKRGYDVHEVETIIYTLATKYISFSTEGRFVKSGLKESDLDKEQLGIGTKIEMEHTNDKEIARRIAKDHLAESVKFKNEKYYTYLIDMEKRMKTD